MGLQTDENSRISKLAMAAQACAVGQASAAIFGNGAIGKTRSELESAVADIERWLKAAGHMPDWPRFDAIAPAQSYSARHGAILLPWKAALDALP
jgi:NifU-like protein involved in Fe-S cluster formation